MSSVSSRAVIAASVLRVLSSQWYNTKLRLSLLHLALLPHFFSWRINKEGGIWRPNMPQIRYKCGSRYWTPLLLPPPLPAGAAVTGCVWESPAPVTAALSSSAASGFPPAAAWLSAGSAGSSCGPCPGSFSQRRCSSRAAGGTPRCPCWCSSCLPGPAELAGGRRRSPGGQKHKYVFGCGEAGCKVVFYYFLTHLSIIYTWKHLYCTHTHLRVGVAVVVVCAPGAQVVAETGRRVRQVRQSHHVITAPSHQSLRLAVWHHVHLSQLVIWCGVGQGVGLPRVRAGPLLDDWGHPGIRHLEGVGSRKKMSFFFYVKFKCVSVCVCVCVYVFILLFYWKQRTTCTKQKHRRLWQLQK